MAQTTLLHYLMIEMAQKWRIWLKNGEIYAKNGEI